MLSGHTDTGNTQLKQNHNSYATAAIYIARRGFEFQPSSPATLKSRRPRQHASRQVQPSSSDMSLAL